MIFQIREGSVEGIKQEYRNAKNQKKDVMFKITRTIPAYIGESIFNYQLLKQLERRLKGYAVKIQIKGGPLKVLIISYSKSKSKGVFELNELPEAMFIGFNQIPRIDIHEGVDFQ